MISKRHGCYPQMIEKPKTHGKKMWEIRANEPIDYVPPGFQCKSCANLKELCKFDFRRMPIRDAKTYLPCIIVNCTEHKEV